MRRQKGFLRAENRKMSIKDKEKSKKKRFKNHSWDYISYQRVE
jgi:hypothetical protein